MDGSIQICFYWGGEVIRMEIGSDYKNGQYNLISVYPVDKITDMLHMVHNATKIASEEFFVESILFRVPVKVFSGIIFQTAEILDDDDVQRMFQHMQMFTDDLSFFEIYLFIAERTRNDDVNEGNEGDEDGDWECNDDSEDEASVLNDDDSEDAPDGSDESDENMFDENDSDSDEGDDDVDEGEPSHIDRNAIINVPSYIESYNTNETVDLDAMRVHLNADDVDANMIDSTDGLYKGMLFGSKEDCKLAIHMHAIQNNYEFCSKEARMDTFVWYCKKRSSGCQWRVRARRLKDDCRWKISQYDAPHTCLSQGRTQDHGHLTVKLISCIVESLVSEAPEIKIKALQAEIQDRLDHLPNYKKTWLAK